MIAIVLVVAIENHPTNVHGGQTAGTSGCVMSLVPAEPGNDHTCPNGSAAAVIVGVPRTSRRCPEAGSNRAPPANHATSPCACGLDRSISTSPLGRRRHGTREVRISGIGYAVVTVMPVLKNRFDWLAASVPVWLCVTNKPQYFGMLPPNNAATENGRM